MEFSKNQKVNTSNLSENVAGECLVHDRAPVNELEQVHAESVLLHHHLVEVGILEEVAHSDDVRMAQLLQKVNLHG